MDENMGSTLGWCEVQFDDTNCVCLSVKWKMIICSAVNFPWDLVFNRGIGSLHLVHTTVKCQNNNCNNFHWEEKIQENLVLNTEVQFDYFQGTKYLHRYSIRICSLKFTSYRVRSHECILVNYSQSRALKLEVWIAVLFWIYSSWAQKSL